MDRSPPLTLREAAQRLGVHYQTVYRWVRRGELVAKKVAGTYLVEPSDLDDFALARLQPVPPPKLLNVRDWDRPADRLHGALVVGDELAAREILDRLRDGGVSIAAMCDRVMTPALARIGEDWASGRLSIAEEHRASAICERLLGRLTPAPPGRPRGVCVVVSPPDEDHELPGAMATAALREDRWRVHHLGTRVPPEAIEALVVAEDAELVVVPVTYPPARLGARLLADRLAVGGRRVLVGQPGLRLQVLLDLARGGEGGDLAPR